MKNKFNNVDQNSYIKIIVMDDNKDIIIDSVYPITN